MDACPSFAELSGTDYLKLLHARAEAAGVPLSASMELTERCNLSCRHCYLGDQARLRGAHSRELTTDGWRNVLDQLALLGCLRLLITGGEPLLRADFPEVYRHARERGLLVTVFTNGTLVSDSTIALFRELPPSAVEVTLYGATAETYESITGVAGSFARCLAGVERLRALGVDLAVKTVVLQPNRHEFHRIGEMARSLGNRRFRFDIEIQGTFDGGSGPAGVRLPAEEAVALEFSDAEAAGSWRAYHERRRGMAPARPDRLYNCSAGQTSVHVNPYGELLPCLSVRHVRFDLRRGTVAEGLADLRRQLAARTAPPDHACRGCTARMICSSCPAVAVLEHGAEDRPAPYQCQVTRSRQRRLERSEGV